MAETALSSRYDASIVEAKWYSKWEEAGLFQPDPDPAKPPYTITIPPPNITGSLHMGHALCYPIQDLLGRYQRLMGKSVLVLPGQDHAGIATQSVVSKQLKKEGVNPVALGREKFIERVWEWRKESGDTILHQLRTLGCAFDWSKTRFTLDPDYAEAVLKVFIDWFDRGLIYHGKRVVNWDPVLRTSVSDIETERKIVRGKLYHIRYPFEDGSGFVTIATTRPETMLADVAVAVHPSDARYQGLVGKRLTLPLMNRSIPLIADTYPDPEFGTGAVKITPAHDPNDYEVGVRHGLEMPVILDEAGVVNEAGGPYAGLDRLEARKRVVADLESQGFLVEIEDYDIPLLVSERSGEPIEPLLAESWFAKQQELAQPAIQAVKAGRVRFSPDRFNRIFLDWMENIRDWNISRKLWWGHRVPVYYTESGQAVAALSWEDAERKAGGSKIVRQDEEVLDTWFSSGLWPFATLGWPQSDALLKERYPTSMLITDRNIIYLWVARMIMMGIDLVGNIPFDDVFIYATVLTEDGRRMSKSLGTGVDPMGVIEKVGADALRFTLLSQTGQNQDIRYSERRTEDARNYCNKIWNASRFVLMNLEGFDPMATPEFDIVDQWMLDRLFVTEAAVREAYDHFDVQGAAQTLYDFFWSDFCDWYIEISKDRLAQPGARQAPQTVLVRCLEAFLKMLHPIMPHITEEIFGHLPTTPSGAFLMASDWPTVDPSWSRPAARQQVERWFSIVRQLRALRAELGLGSIKMIPEAYFEGDMEGGEAVVASQAWISELKSGTPPTALFVTAAGEGMKVHLPIEGLIDIAEKIESLKKSLEKSESELAKIDAQLANPMFSSRAKPEAIEKAQSQAEELKSKIQSMQSQLALFSSCSS